MYSQMTKGAFHAMEVSLKRNLIGVVLFDIRTHLVHNSYNQRKATPTSINAFYRATGYGTQLQTKSLDTAIHIMCHRECVDPSTVSTDVHDEPHVVRWTEFAVSHPPHLMDGTHRLGVLDAKVVQPLQDEAEEVNKHIVWAEKEGKQDVVDKLKQRLVNLQARIDKDALWLAMLFDQGTALPPVMRRSGADFMSRRTGK